MPQSPGLELGVKVADELRNGRLIERHAEVADAHRQQLPRLGRRMLERDHWLTSVQDGCHLQSALMKYWLMKSEPSAYSIDDLQRDGTTTWNGVRNFLARNYMRDHMKVGDKVLFYASNAKPSGVTGIAQVSGAAR